MKMLKKIENFSRNIEKCFRKIITCTFLELKREKKKATGKIDIIRKINREYLPLISLVILCCGAINTAATFEVTWRISKRNENMSSENLPN